MEMTDNKSRFWEDKKIFITGYEGFLGSNLTKILLGYDAKVWGLDIITHRKNTILSDEDLNKIKITKGSVGNFSLVSEIIRENNIEFIFHLAAEALVGRCNKNPLRTFSTNIKGSWNVLEASRNTNSIKTIIVASSDKAYGIQKELPYRENSPLAGCHPYDVSKSCTDLLAYTYFRTYHLPVCITRCGNLYGPGDFNFSRIVPDTVRSALRNKTLIIRSDGLFNRDYNYVEDIVRGYLLLAQKAESLKLYGEAFNFSNEAPVSVLELVRMILKLAGQNEFNYKIANTAKYEIRHQYLSAQKAQRVLKWSPRYTFEEGLKKTIEWYGNCLGESK